MEQKTMSGDNTDVRGEWSMNEDYYKLVSAQLAAMMDAKNTALASPSKVAYEDWYEQIHDVHTIVGNLFKDKDYAETQKLFEDINKKMGYDKNGELNIEIEDEPLKQREITEELRKLQNHMVRCAFKNGLIIKIGEVHKFKSHSRA